MDFVNLVLTIQLGMVQSVFVIQDTQKITMVNVTKIVSMPLGTELPVFAGVDTTLSTECVRNAM